MKLFTGLLALGFALTLSVSTAEAAKGKKKNGVEAAFKRIDTNGDGKITKEEWHKAHEGKGKGKGKKHHHHKHFAKIDTNHDGVISLEEFKAAHHHKGKKKA